MHFPPDNRTIAVNCLTSTLATRYFHPIAWPAPVIVLHVGHCNWSVSGAARKACRKVKELISLVGAWGFEPQTPTVSNALDGGPTLLKSIALNFLGKICTACTASADCSAPFCVPNCVPHLTITFCDSEILKQFTHTNTLRLRLQVIYWKLNLSYEAPSDSVNQLGTFAWRCRSA